MKKICMGSVLILIMSLLVGCSLSNAETISEVETLSIMQTVEKTSESDAEETAESSTERYLKEELLLQYCKKSVRLYKKQEQKL